MNDQSMLNLNNQGIVHLKDGRWEDGIDCFTNAIQQIAETCSVSSNIQLVRITKPDQLINHNPFIVLPLAFKLYQGTETVVGVSEISCVLFYNLCLAYHLMMIDKSNQHYHVFWDKLCNIYSMIIDVTQLWSETTPSMYMFLLITYNNWVNATFQIFGMIENTQETMDYIFSRVYHQQELLTEEERCIIFFNIILKQTTAPVA